jgi:hypothetical protein
MALTTGMKLGPYEILSPLGAGGMGEAAGPVNIVMNGDAELKRK